MEVERVKPPQPKKNLWKPEEDLILKNYVEAHGEGNWATVSERSGLMRGGKSCRLRWKNYLRPNIKRGEMSKEEEDLIIRMHKLLGNRWSLIAGRLPGRTDNEVKNYWNTHLNKRCLVGKRKATDSISYHHDEDKEENINKKNKLCQSDQKCNGSCPDLTKLCLDGRKEEEEKDHEESTTSNPWKWKDDSRNSFEYCDMEYPIMGAGGNNNNASFVFDDEPLIAYLDSFVVFEAFGCDGEEAYAQMQSVMEY